MFLLCSDAFMSRPSSSKLPLVLEVALSIAPQQTLAALASDDRKHRRQATQDLAAFLADRLAGLGDDREQDSWEPTAQTPLFTDDLRPLG